MRKLFIIACPTTTTPAIAITLSFFHNATPWRLQGFLHVLSA
jgi:hypothetical protein